MPKTRDPRLETLLYLLLACRRNARQGPPVKRVERGENLEPPLLVTEFARQFK